MEYQMQVHLVDDDTSVRTTLARLIASAGYQVREYASGKEFLEISSSLTSGCVVLDIRMPELDGFAVQRELGARGFSLPIIMMTGSGDLRVPALKGGATDFIQKPFGRSEIVAALAEVASGEGST